MARRAAIIAASIALTLSGLAWGASIARVTWYNPRAAHVRVIALWAGMLNVHNGGAYTLPGCQVGPRARRVDWWPYDGIFWEYYPGTAQWPGANWRLQLPLWMPAALSGAGLAIAWRPWGRRGRRRRLGLCEGCGYDLSGLGGGAVCPECGKAKRRDAGM